MYRHLKVTEQGPVLQVSLDRPAVHNAFNDELIDEAIELFSRTDKLLGFRAVLLTGEGKTFCAGADLNWMARMVGYSRDENIHDSANLAKMFHLMNACPVPLIGRIHGAAIGGGVGLVSVCDIVLAMQDSKFALSEVKLGILPAVISPYLVRKIGEGHARALLLTGERFGAERAEAIGLVHRVARTAEELDALVVKSVEQILTSGPEAVRECKKLVSFVATNPLEESIPYTIDAIAERRVSEEGQKGMQAFLEKRPAPWTQE